MQDPLVPYLIRHALAGVLAGWVTVVVLLGLDVLGLGTLVSASDLWPIPLLMLLLFFGFTFGSVAMAAAIMSIGREDAQSTAVAAHRRPAPFERARGTRSPRVE